MAGKKKPTITRREASRLEAEAGAAAYEKAATASGDPRSVRALLDAARVDDVAGHQVVPLMLETLLCLEELWDIEHHKSSKGTLRQAQTLYTYLHPQKARSLWSAKWASFEAAVRSWSSATAVADYHALSLLVLRHLQDFYSGGGEPKKKPVQKPSKTGPVD